MLHDIAESRKVGRTTGGLEVSDCGEEVVPNGGKWLVIALGQGKAVRVEKTSQLPPLDMASKVNHGPHISAEGGRVNAAALKKGPIRCLVGPFVEEVGKMVMAACVVLSDGTEMRGEEETRGGGAAGAPLLPGVPEVVEDDDDP